MVDIEDVRKHSAKVTRPRDALMFYAHTNPAAMMFLFVLGFALSPDQFISVASKNFNHCATAGCSDAVLKAVPSATSPTALSLVPWLWLGSFAAGILGSLIVAFVPSHAGSLLLRYRIIQTTMILSPVLFTAGLYLVIPSMIDRTKLPFLIFGGGWVLFSGAVLSYSFYHINPREFGIEYFVVPGEKLKEILGARARPSEKRVAHSADASVSETSLLESLAKELENRDDIEPDDAIDDLLDALDKLLSRDVRSILQMSFLDLSHLKKKSWRFVTRVAAECLEQEIENQKHTYGVENPLVWSTHMEYALLLLLSTSSHELAPGPISVLCRCMASSRIRHVISIITPRIWRGPRTDVDTLRIVLERLRVREVLVHCEDLNVMHEALQDLIEEYLCHHEHDHDTFQAPLEAHRVELVQGGMTDIIMPMFIRAAITRIHPDIPNTWALICTIRTVAAFWSPDVSWSSSALELLRKTFYVIPHAYILTPNLIAATHENFDEIRTNVVKVCFLQGCAADQYQILRVLSQMLSNDWRPNGCVDSDPYQETYNPIYPLKLAQLCLALLRSMNGLPAPGTRAANLWGHLWDDMRMALGRYSRGFIVSGDREIATDVIQEIRALLGTGNPFDTPEEWVDSYRPQEDAFFPRSLLDALVFYLKPEVIYSPTVLSPIHSRAPSPIRTRPATPWTPVEGTPAPLPFVELYHGPDDLIAPGTMQGAPHDSPINAIIINEDTPEQD